MENRDKMLLSNQDELEVVQAAKQLSECGSLTESEDKELVESFAFDQLMKLRGAMEDPSDLDNFMKKHWHEIAKLEKEPESKKKSIILRAWECLVYAIKKGLAFLKNHWKKILLLVLLIGAYLLFKNSGAVLSFGDKLFGAKHAVEGWRTAMKWIPVDAADVDNVAAGIGDSGVWQSTLKTTGEIVHGILSDPSDNSSPIKWFKLSK